MANKGGRRLAVCGAAIAAGLVATLLPAAPASAHVRLSADKANAGARDVTITFTGEGESARAGISGERVALPDGIPIADVRLVDAPEGWKFSAGTEGYTISGPALQPRADAVYTIRVAQLPATGRMLVFKTMETYSDGSVARWIDLPGAERPAPVLMLQPAATSAAAPAPAAAGPDAGHSAAATVMAVALMTVALLVVAGLVFLVVRTRRRGA